MDKQFIHSTTRPKGGQWEMERIACQKTCSARGVAVANKGAVGFWLWICDCATNGADAPDFCPVFVPAGVSQSLDWSQSPEKFEHGIYVCATTDPVTKTLITTPDAFFDIAYEIARS